MSPHRRRLIYNWCRAIRSRKTAALYTLRIPSFRTGGQHSSHHLCLPDGEVTITILDYYPHKNKGIRSAYTDAFIYTLSYLSSRYLSQSPDLDL